MKVRMLQGFRRPKENIKRGRSLFTLRGEEGKRPRRVVIAAALVALLAVLAFSLRADPVLMNSAEIATIWDHGVLRVGVRADVPGMGQDGAGLEIELAALLARKIMEADKRYIGTNPLELVEVSAMNVAAKLSNGAIDAAICLMPKGANAAYAYSRAYYADEILLLTRPDEANIRIENIDIGCIQNASSTSLYVPSGAVYNALAAYIDAHPQDGLTTVSAAGTSSRRIVAYASYEDLFRGLANGEVGAAALSALTAKKHEASHSFGVSPVKIGTVEYAVVSLAEQSAVAALADIMLANMEQDGSLAALKEKYGLE